MLRVYDTRSGCCSSRGLNGGFFLYARWRRFPGDCCAVVSPSLESEGGGGCCILKWVLYPYLGIDCYDDGTVLFRFLLSCIEELCRLDALLFFRLCLFISSSAFCAALPPPFLYPLFIILRRVYVCVRSSLFFHVFFFLSFVTYVSYVCCLPSFFVCDRLVYYY